MSLSGAVVCGALTTIPVGLMTIGLIVNTIRDRGASAAMKDVATGTLARLSPGPTVVTGRLTTTAPVDAPLSGPVLAYKFVLKENQVKITGKARLKEVVNDVQQAPLQLVSADGACAVEGDTSDLWEDGQSGSSNLLAGRPPERLLEAMARYNVEDSKMLGMERAREWSERVLREQEVAVFGDVEAGGQRLTVKRIAKGTRGDLETKLTEGGNWGSTFGSIVVVSFLIPLAALCGGLIIK